jgi:hypothetical protein
MKNIFIFFQNCINAVTLVIALLFFTTSGFAQLHGLDDPGNILKPLYGDVTPIRSCEELAKVSIPNGVIESAVIDPSDNSCTVTVIVNHPPADDHVTVWVKLPMKGWNGRLYGVGGGGWVSGYKFNMPLPVSKGFAAVTTDGGHSTNLMTGAGFALDPNNHLRWQEVRDYAYLSVHDMTVVAKALVHAFYGKPVRYSYFVGISNGGREGITEALRYPEDYNGIFAGAPAINLANVFLSISWAQTVMLETKNVVSKEKLVAVNKAVIAACDGADGVVDGVIDNPLSCTWDPKSFVGTKVGESTFTDADAEVVRRIWEGPRRTNGESLWHGLDRGADLTAVGSSKGAAFALEFVRYLLLHDPNWKGPISTIAEFELLHNQAMDQYGSTFASNDPDLTKFRDHGGKLLVLHGMADQLIPAQNSIQYYESVKAKMGGAKRTAEFARLFLMPGLDHALAGTGPIATGELIDLVRWVEQGKAPDRINCECRDKAGKVTRTRPVFLYPTEARYIGKGSTDDAVNFVKER